MAIKGKKKPKARSPRAVTPGPRRAVYVQPKVPLFQRTGAKFVVALIAEAIVFSLLVGFGEQSRTDHQKERVQELTSLIETNLAKAGEAIQPIGAGAQILPQLTTTLTDLQGEQPPEEEVVIAQADAWISALTDAADGVAGLEVPVEGMDPDQRLALTEARTDMERGLRLYAGLAADVKVAVQIEGKARDELITTIQEQVIFVQGTFDAGYGKLQRVRERLGLPTTSATGTGFPTGVTPEQGIPGFEPPVLEEGTPIEEIDEGDAGNGGGGGNKGGGGGGNG